MTIFRLVGPLAHSLGGVMSSKLPVQPIRKERISQRVASEICRLIRIGEFQPGDHLPAERDLAAMLSVSRTTLREALRGLELTGIIETRHGGGTVVRKFSGFGIESPLAMIYETSHNDLSDLWEMRRIVEPALAERAAVRASKDDIEWLGTMLERHWIPHHSASLDDVTRDLDREFHSGVARLTGNAAADQVIQLLNTLVHREYRAQRRYIQERRKIAYHHHIAIYEAIKRRDPDGAREAMLEHLREVEEFIFDELIDEQGENELEDTYVDTSSEWGPDIGTEV